MEIPLHHFTKDDETSIPFRIEELVRDSGYNTGVPHRHNYYEIFFFEKGGGHHSIDFEVLPVRSRSIHFVSPGQVHLLNRAADSRGSVILFSRDFYYLGLQEKNLLFEMPFLNNAMTAPVLNLSQDEYGQCREWLKAMKGEVSGDQAYARHQLRSYLNILMVHCKRLFEARAGERQAQSHPLYHRFRAVLEENYMKLHLAKDYPSLLNTSEKHLGEVVKSATGKPVLEHIHERLLLEARRLLRHSELSSKEISWHLGFEDPSHFSRFFKSKMKASPTEYREGEEIYQ